MPRVYINQTILILSRRLFNLVIKSHEIALFKVFFIWCSLHGIVVIVSLLNMRAHPSTVTTGNSPDVTCVEDLGFIQSFHIVKLILHVVPIVVHLSSVKKLVLSCF